MHSPRLSRSGAATGHQQQDRSATLAFDCELPASTAVAVFLDGNDYGAAELIAGASTAQELRSAWCAVFLVPTNHDPVTDVSARSAAHLNRKLAESLGGTVVNVVTEDAIEGAIRFARVHHIKHVIVGRPSRATRSTAGSFEQRVAASLRGVEVRVVRSAEPRQRTVWQTWFNRQNGLPAILLFAVLVLATAAIVYVSWPIVFALVVVGAAVWCWQLEQRAST